MPIAAICLVDRPYADLGITSCAFSWTGDELGNDSGWKPIPIDAWQGLNPRLVCCARRKGAAEHRC